MYTTIQYPKKKLAIHSNGISEDWKINIPGMELCSANDWLVFLKKDLKVLRRRVNDNWDLRLMLFLPDEIDDTPLMILERAVKLVDFGWSAEEIEKRLLITKAAAIACIKLSNVQKQMITKGFTGITIHEIQPVFPDAVTYCIEHTKNVKRILKERKEENV